LRAQTFTTPGHWKFDISPLELAFSESFLVLHEEIADQFLLSFDNFVGGVVASFITRALFPGRVSEGFSLYVQSSCYSK
jgi:hypothetical protein